MTPGFARSESAKRAEREFAATRRRYNRIAGFYDLLEIFDERRFRPWRLRMLARASGRVLEVGIGTGKNIPGYPAGVELIGIDAAEGMLAIARARSRRSGAPVDLVLADVQALPFRDGAFDTVVSSFVFCSVPDPLAGLLELRRVVRPEGKILMLEHLPGGRPAPGVMGRLLQRIAGGLLGPAIRNRMALELFRQAGLEITRIETRQAREDIREIETRPGKMRLPGAGLAA